MREPPADVDRKALLDGARQLLERLRDRFVSRVAELEGKSVIVISGVEEVFLSWAKLLALAPAKLLEPPKLRAIVDEAIGEAMRRRTDLLEFQLGPELLGRILRDFSSAIDRERFVDARGKQLAVWLGETLRLPVPELGVATVADRELAERVSAMTHEERASTTQLDLGQQRVLRDLSPLRELPALHKVEIHAAHLLADVSPLGDLANLEVLVLNAPGVTDLTPLQGLTRLRKLEVWAAVTDLDWLAGNRSLEELDLQVCPSVTEIGVLAGHAGLRMLTISTDGVRDLSALAKMPSLRELGLSGKQPADLSRVTDLLRLTALRISQLPIRSLDVAVRLKELRKLVASHCEDLEDITAVAGLLQLEELDLTASSMRDLSAVAWLPELRVLRGRLTDIAELPHFASLPKLEEFDFSLGDLATLAGFEAARALRKLSFGTEEILDLSPLSSVTSLEELTIQISPPRRDDLPLSDLRPLAALHKLKELDIDGGGVWDLSPLSGLTALEHVRIHRTLIEDVEVLAPLPELRHVELLQCDLLTSIRPLASCPKLEKLVVLDCERLTGPRTIEQLRAPEAAAPVRRYPSAGVAPRRPGALTVVDLRGSLPRTPPEGWSVPEMEHDMEGVCWIDAKGVLLQVSLGSPEEKPQLLVTVAPRNALRATDKLVARILRRFRACDAFVELAPGSEWHRRHVPEDVPFMRAFVAWAHPASPDGWATVRQTRPKLRVEPSGSGARAERSASSMDVDEHLPSPLPEGWKVEVLARDPEDVRHIVTPRGELIVVLRREEGSDVVKLSVGFFPPPDAPYVSDDYARAVLRAFRRTGVFEESAVGPFAQAPGMRSFVAATHR